MAGKKGLHEPVPVAPLPEKKAEKLQQAWRRAVEFGKQHPIPEKAA